MFVYTRSLSMVAVLCLAVVTIATVGVTPASSGWNPFKKKNKESKSNIASDVREAMERFREKDPGLSGWFEKARGYAVFPKVGKGGMGVGAAYGKGQVYEQGQLIGRTSLKQITVGFQLGGQSYSEVIFFKDKKALDAFKKGHFEFNAQVSAVAVTAGASADAAYEHGVAVFTMARGGLMYEATVGGQKFTFDAVEGASDGK
jgi:lipid-binding SYLF domain-containing protein